MDTPVSVGPIPLPVHCDCDNETCTGDVVQIDTSCARELFIRCNPASILSTGSAPQEQAEQFYHCLPRILERAGMGMNHVVQERVFFQDIARDFPVFTQVRRAAYRRGGTSDVSLPIASHVEQPPCTPGQAFELQIYALAAPVGETKSERKPKVTTVPAHDNCPAAKIVQLGGYRHLYVRNVAGMSPGGRPLGTFREQCDAMFQTVAQLLSGQSATFAHVLRTWCYLDDMEGDYDEFNESRNAFFRREGIQRLPASTGIRAGLYPSGTRCCVDCYALLNPVGAEIAVMHTPTLNEAPEYGSSFSRGMKLTLPEKTVLFISGTASVDESGATAHVGDMRRQIERMLLNVKELLTPHGASFADLVQVITYLKSAHDLDLFREVAQQWGLINLPNSIVQADVCRPDLLCEIEAIAILPH